MKKVLGVALLALFIISTSASAQDQPFKFQLRGEIRDQNSAVVPGILLCVHPGTDINGEFQVRLAPGDYELTVDGLRPEVFRAFIKIVENGLNPNYLVLAVDSGAIRCSKDESGADHPKVINSQTPLYPPAARALRAIGEVTVDVAISSDGTVASAKPVSGHPLLRAAARVAAEKFVFEMTGESQVRETRLVFVFLDCAEEKTKLKRYGCSYRIIVSPECQMIDTTESR